MLYYGSNWLRVAEVRLNAAIEEVARAIEVLRAISSTNQGIPHKAGFVAEEMHALSFNLRAITEDLVVAAYTDRHECFYEYNFKRNCPADIVMVDEYGLALAQVKYYYSAFRTAVALREIRDGKHVYNGMQLVVPREQLIDVIIAARKTVLKELAKRRLPVAAAAQYVVDHTSDYIIFGQCWSDPVSNKQAHAVANDPWGPVLQEYIKPHITNLVNTLILTKIELLGPTAPFLSCPNDTHERRTMGYTECYVEALNWTRAFCSGLERQFWNEACESYMSTIDDGRLPF